MTQEEKDELLEFVDEKEEDEVLREQMEWDAKNRDESGNIIGFMESEDGKTLKGLMGL